MGDNQSRGGKTERQLLPQHSSLSKKDATMSHHNTERSISGPEMDLFGCGKVSTSVEIGQENGKNTDYSVTVSGPFN